LLIYETWHYVGYIANMKEKCPAIIKSKIAVILAMQKEIYMSLMEGFTY
jgi:hypothetical protein